MALAVQYLPEDREAVKDHKSELLRDFFDKIPELTEFVQGL
jgi:hypothetical protein